MVLCILYKTCCEVSASHATITNTQPGGMTQFGIVLCILSTAGHHIIVCHKTPKVFEYLDLRHRYVRIPMRAHTPDKL